MNPTTSERSSEAIAAEKAPDVNRIPLMIIVIVSLAGGAAFGLSLRSIAAGLFAYVLLVLAISPFYSLLAWLFGWPALGWMHYFDALVGLSNLG